MLKEIERYAKLVNEVLEKELPEKKPAELWRYVREYPLRGGKRLRPALVMLSAEMFGKKAGEVVEAAAAVEMLHNFTLIHDDIEDHSLLRRGKPALHRIAGVELAINAGDALMAKAFELMARGAGELASEVIEKFGRVLVELAEGQAMDISWTLKGEVPEENDFLEMTEKKTGALIGFSLWLGAKLAGEEKSLKTLEKVGRAMGIAFQLRDDVLDVRGGKEFGKELGRDIAEGKRTLLLIRAVKTLGYGEKLELLGKVGSKSRGDVNRAIELIEKSGAVEYVQRRAEEFARKARELAETLPQCKQREILLQLIEFAVKRDK